MANAEFSPSNMTSDASTNHAPEQDVAELVPPEQIEWVNGFATPPSLPVRPFHALASVFK